MKKTLTVLLLAMAVSLTCAAQSTSKLSATKANEYGLIYTLPVTRLQIAIAAEKTVETPGEFYLYARKYLNATPIAEPSTRWRITEAVVNPVAVADEDNRYLVTLKGGNGAFVMVSDDNFPLSINDDSYNPEIAADDLPEAVKAEPTILELPVARQAVSEEMLQSRSSVKRAELAAAKIYELRTNRNDVVSGQSDANITDGNAMKLALSTIDSQEEALTAMFLGTKSTSVEVSELYAEIPEPDAAGTRTVIARLSALNGIVAPDDLSGAPIYLTVTPVTTGQLPVNEKGETKSFPKGGVAYRIPGTARVTLECDGKVLVDKTVEVPQYGVVFGLDPSLFTNKKAPSYLHFNPLTGGIRELGEVR